jgi:hypothetical protein
MSKTIAQQLQEAAEGASELCGDPRYLPRASVLLGMLLALLMSDLVFRHLGLDPGQLSGRRSGHEGE